MRIKDTQRSIGKDEKIFSDGVLFIRIDDLRQADLVEMINYELYNECYRYLLTVIDMFSKQAWAVAIENKTGDSVTKSMKSIFDDEQRKSKNLQTDDGKEFYNKTFQNLLKLNHISHYSTYSILKASFVEQTERIWQKINFTFLISLFGK